MPTDSRNSKCQENFAISKYFSFLLRVVYLHLYPTKCNLLFFYKLRPLKEIQAFYILCKSICWKNVVLLDRVQLVKDVLIAPQTHLCEPTNKLHLQTPRSVTVGQQSGNPTFREPEFSFQNPY